MMRFLTIISLLISLTACKPSPKALTVGTIAGPETELVEAAKEVAQERYGLDLRIVEFNDYNLPNEALEDGSIDANVYQHLPYLKAAIQAHGYSLQAIGKTFIYPTGIYSQRIKSLADLPANATIAIPNDPSNEGRALLLLQKAGLISLKNQEVTVSLADIEANPRNLRIKELDAAQLPRVLADVDAAVINTNYAISAGLNPEQDAIYSEDKDSPYANLIVARLNSPKQMQLEQLVKALNSNKVKNKAKDLFGAGAISAW